MKTYMTSLGDTWDKIAFNVLGDEKYTENLMAANQDEKLLSTVIFDAGTVINIPEIDESNQTDESLPPWRTS